MKTVKIENQEVVLGNIFCIGRNYAEHVKELNNSISAEPVVFLKPTSALVQTDEKIKLPDFSHDVHHECELVVYIKEDAYLVDESEAMNYVGGYAIGLDLTARDVQSSLKSKGLPWTKAKGFSTAACISHFISPEKAGNMDAQEFSLLVNGEVRQKGNTQDMFFSFSRIVSYLSNIYGLQAGDIIYTGTPAGVAAIKSGDKLELIWPEKITVTFHVV